MSKHITAGELIKKLQRLPPEAKVIIPNDYDYNEGIYYVTSTMTFCNGGEQQVLLDSNYKTIAKGWADNE